MADQVFARFRVSTIGGLDATSPAGDGEVEDYRVTITNTTPWQLQQVYGFFDTGNDYRNSGGCDER